MMIYGKLLLTANGCNLDEIRSLLQKALRRKETALVKQSCKELIGYGKDQLPWKSIMTFLFEDHCLSDGNTLEVIWKLYKVSAYICNVFLSMHMIMLHVSSI